MAITVLDVQRVAVIGAGVMGTGIAQVAARAGYQVELFDAAAGAVQKALERIGDSLARAVEKGRCTGPEREDALRRLSEGASLEAAAAQADLVIEAAPEDLALKKDLFARLSRAAKADAILASNTSSLPITAIAAAAKGPERVVGLHFFNPAPVLPLVEVVRTELTDEAVYESAYSFAAALGKEPIRCHDTPGFVVNRVLIPLLNDCVRVLDEARVTPEDLDAGMKHGAGWPMGPCELVDLVGIDVHVHASEALWDALREPRMAPPPRLVSMQKAGLLGRKSGQGFYRY